MNGLKKYLATGVLAASMLFGTAAQAMQVSQYDKMDPHDEGHYITLLVKGVYDDLVAQGQTQQANDLLTFFQDSSDKGGSYQFEKNLEIVRAVNQKNAADPNNKTSPYEVEHAMALTLKNDGIVIPVSKLLAINKDFKPAYPPAKTTK